MEELGIGRPSTYAADPRRRCATANTCASRRSGSFRRTRAASSRRSSKAFSAATSSTISRPISRRSSTRSPTTRSTGSRSCAISGGTFPPPSASTKELRTTEVLDALNEILGPHIFPPRSDGAEPAHLPDLRHRPALAQARALRRLRRLLELSRMPLHAPVHGLGRRRERRGVRHPSPRRRSRDRLAGDGARRALRALHPARRGRGRREAETRLDPERAPRRHRSTSTRP